MTVGRILLLIQGRQQSLLIRFDILVQKSQSLSPSLFQVAVAHLDHLWLESGLRRGLHFLKIFDEQTLRVETDKLARPLGLIRQFLQLRHLIIEQHLRVEQRLLVRYFKAVALRQVVETAVFVAAEPTPEEHTINAASQWLMRLSWKVHSVVYRSNII